MREAVRAALGSFAARFSDGAPSFDERVLRSRYGDTSVWPADGEFGLVLLAWALGPGFHLAGFRQALTGLVPDFDAAARSIGPGGNPSLVTIGGAARTALRNAAIVVRWNLPSEILYWPAALANCAGATL